MMQFHSEYYMQQLFIAGDNEDNYFSYVKSEA